jgi:hypothetical protein
MFKPIALATLVAGTLDILFAVILTLYYGREPGNMLRYVASGPLPPATEWETAGALLGLVVHFTLIAIMASVFVLAARRYPDLLHNPLKWGLIYGLITYVVMNWIVVPFRFDTPLPPKPISIATQLFAHIVLVGLPIAWITAKTLLQPPSGAAGTVHA